MHGHTALRLHGGQALWLIVSCIIGTWGRQVVVVPHGAYKLLLQMPEQVEQDERATFPAAGLVVMLPGDQIDPKAHAEPGIACANLRRRAKRTPVRLVTVRLAAVFRHGKQNSHDTCVSRADPLHAEPARDCMSFLLPKL